MLTSAKHKGEEISFQELLKDSACYFFNIHFLIRHSRNLCYHLILFILCIGGFWTSSLSIML